MEFENSIFHGKSVHCLIGGPGKLNGICFWMPFLMGSCDFEEYSFVELDEIDHVKQQVWVCFVIR